MSIQLGNIKGLPEPQLREDEDWFFVPIVAMKGLGLEYARKGYYQGAVLDRSMPEHRKLMQRVLDFIDRHEAIQAFNKDNSPLPAVRQ